MDKEKLELIDFIGQKWEEVKNKIIEEAQKDERDRIKCHFDYLNTHCGHRQEISWMRNELFGKEQP